MILTDTSDAAAVYLDDLVANPDNPRQTIGDVTELAESIRSVGVLTPLLVVCNDPERMSYMVVDGHRRLAALQHLNFDDTIPVRVVELNVTERLLAALATQGKPLDPIDEAKAFQHLIDLGLTQRQIADKVGCNQSHVSRRLSLVQLDDDKAAAVTSGTMKVRDAEHAARGKTPAPVAKKSRDDIAQHPRFIAEAERGERLAAENERLREIAAKAREAVVEVKAALAERDDDVEADPATGGVMIAETIASARGEQYVVQCSWCGTLLCVPGTCQRHDLGTCPACQREGGSWWGQTLPVGMFASFTIDEDTCLTCRGTGLWNGEPCECQPDATDIAKCPKPEQGTVGEQSHCQHWFQESMDDDPGACCWCGSADDDSGSCRPTTNIDSLFPDVAGEPPANPAWATKQPWGTYTMSSDDRTITLIGKLTKPDSIRHVITYETAHDGRTSILDAARGRLVELGDNVAAA